MYLGLYLNHLESNSDHDGCANPHNTGEGCPRCKSDANNVINLTVQTAESSDQNTLNTTSDDHNDDYYNDSTDVDTDCYDFPSH